MTTVDYINNGGAVRQWRIDCKVGRRSRGFKTWDQYTHEGGEFDEERFITKTAEAFLVDPSQIILLCVSEVA